MKTEYFTLWISNEVKEEPETAAFFDMIDRKKEESGKNVPLFSNKEVEDSNKQNKSPKLTTILLFLLINLKKEQCTAILL